jgi:TolA-binding protein
MPSPISRSFLFASIFAIVAVSHQTAYAQAGAPEQAVSAAQQLMTSGQYKEAVAAYEDVLKNYPTSTVISEAQFRLGYLYFAIGEYDKSLDFLKKVLVPPAPPEMQELATSIIPQALSAKAGKQTDEAKRKAGFEEAVKGFDAFLQKFPNSEQVERVTYSKALTLFQMARYDDAIAGLRSNLQKFPNSESILDSQYFLALSLYTQANVAAQSKQNTLDAANASKLDEAERLLQDIIKKRSDLALGNDAQYQLGEIAFSRGSLSSEEGRKALWDKAIDAYRLVQPKEPMLKAQQTRIDSVRQRKIQALQAKDTALFKRLESLEEAEMTKLEGLKNKPDQTLAALSKVGQIYFLSNDFDRARVVFRQIQKFAEIEDQKKLIQYYLTLTYASQNIVDKAVGAYNSFKSAYKADPMGENLPLIIGSLYLGGTPAPEKAVEIFKEGLAAYPKGRYNNDIAAQQANALVMLQRYDEALAAYRKFLATNPKPEVAATAEFGIATILKDTGKIPEALAQFKKVRDTFSATPPAEQASFWMGQLSLQNNDLSTAVTEFTAFLEKYPKSELAATAKFGIAQAKLTGGDKEAALTLYKEVADQFPKSAPATFTYFQRAQILAGDERGEELLALMKEFVERYPEDDKVFFAYDAIGQSQVNSGAALDAVETYSTMARKRPNDPQAPAAMLNVVQIWRSYAEGQGRYLALNEEQRAEWTKGVSNSISAAEDLISTYPDSPQVASALEELLAVQKLNLGAQIKTQENIITYFQGLGEKFAAKPATRSKILFKLASFIYEGDKAKGLAQMTAAYSPDIIYSPAGIDEYGAALLEAGKIEESFAVYRKLARDYPLPAGTTADGAPPLVQEGQSISLYGIGKAQQAKGLVAEAGATFDLLKTNYPWSPKILEADYGIAESLHKQGKSDEAVELLIPLIRAVNGSAELRAKSMLLLATIQESKGDITSAIDNYIKIAAFYGGVPTVAAEGLWKGAQLLEKQADGLDEKSKPTKSQQLRKAFMAYEDLSTKYPNSPNGVAAKTKADALRPPAK